MPGPSNTHFNMAPVLGTVAFPPVPNLGIGTLTQDDDVTMENATMVPQASSALATAMVSSTLSVHDTAPVPSASTVYTTATVPMASSVSATAMVPQALSVTAAATVPQASSANTGVTVSLASSATASTSMDVDALHAPVNNTMEAEEQATAEIYE